MQIQAYLDNVFDVGQLMEDSDTKNAALERVAQLEDSLYQVRIGGSMKPTDIELKN